MDITITVNLSDNEVKGLADAIAGSDDPDQKPEQYLAARMGSITASYADAYVAKVRAQWSPLVDVVIAGGPDVIERVAAVVQQELQSIAKGE